MYLLVFVTLMISLIGMYTQVIFLQTSRINATQSTLAQAMLNWHYTAADLAHSAIPYDHITPVGCSLGQPIGAIPSCLDYLNHTVFVGGGGTSTLQPCDSWTGTPTYCMTSLPLGYNKTFYNFHSVYYQIVSSGYHTNYLLTYVEPPTLGLNNPAPGYIVMPNGNQLGVTLADLVKQLRHSPLLSEIFYGTVTGTAPNQVLNTKAVFGGITSTTIPVSTSGSIANNSVGIMAEPDDPLCQIGLYDHLTGTCH